MPLSSPKNESSHSHQAGESTVFVETQAPKSTVQNSEQPKSRFSRWWHKIQRLWKRPQPTPTENTVVPKAVSTFLDLAQTQGVPKGHETAVANESQTDTNPTKERKPIDSGTQTYQGQREAEVSNIDRLLGDPTISHEEKKSEKEPEFVWKTNPPGLKIVKQIGKGGMGFVYDAEDLLGQKLAVKVTRPDRMNEHLKNRFYSEAREMSKLDCPYLVPIKHFNEHEGLPYFSMQKYESSVSALVEEKKLTQEAAFRIFKDSIRGLAHLHERGYIHRDFKPGNILVNDKGQALLSDFGLLKQTVEEMTIRTVTTEELILEDRIKTRGVVGTIPYLSPEVLDRASDENNVPTPTPKWDLYAAGITLYEMLHGERPPVSKDPYLFVGKSRMDAIPPIRKVQPKTPKALEKIINKCCAVDSPYTDARDLLRELIRYETRWYRRALLGMSVLFLGMVVSLAMLWPPSQSVAEKTIPNPYAELHKELEEGKTVELIPKEGMPRFPFKVLVGKELYPNNDNEFKSFCAPTVLSGETYVELLPTLPEGQYLIRGEMLFQPVTKLSGTGGFFMGGRIVESFAGNLYTAQSMSLSNQQRGCQATIEGRTRLVAAVRGSDVFEFMNKYDPKINNSQWLSFEIRMTADKNQFTLADVPLTITRNPKRLPLGWVEELNMIHRLKNPNEKIEYLPSGGIGIFAMTCTTHCRNLTITPVKTKE